MATFSILSFCLLLLLSQSTICAAQNGGGGKGGKVELWCVAKNNAEDAALQSALDWACGAGGANCGPIQPGGPCHDSSDLQRTASFAFNDYYIKHGMTQDSCNFDNTAALISINPSFGNCKFPSSSSSASNGSFTGTATGEIGPASANMNSRSSVTHRSSLALIIFNLFFLIVLNSFRG